MKSENLYALILAAGLGTRLRPLTLFKPKPLIEVLRTPLILHILNRFRSLPLRRIFVNTHYLADLLEEKLRAISDTMNPSVDLTVLREDKLLDTGGTIKRVIKLLEAEGVRNGTLLVHNSDVLPIFPLQRLLEEHSQKGGDVTLLCFLPSPLSTSSLSLNVKVENGVVTEIPSSKGNCHFCGVYAIDLHKVKDKLPQEEVFSALEIFRRSSTRAVIYQGFFWDLGTFKGLLTFLSDLSLYVLSQNIMHFNPFAPLELPLPRRIWGKGSSLKGLSSP